MKREHKQLNPSSNMLIHSEIQHLCWGGTSHLLFAFYYMSSSKGMYIHIK